MPKDETRRIQKEIADLGERLGFISEIESRAIGFEDCYFPIHDVVWYLDTQSSFNMEAMEPLFEEKPQWIRLLNKIPFAGFEIEGSTTSSKNQIGNFANLYASDFLFKFVIVNNAAAANENDTYRRGLKINYYFQRLYGQREVIFADWVHIHKTLDIDSGIFQKYEQTYKLNDNILKRAGFGGETKSLEVYDKIIPFVKSTKMILKQNYAPQTAQWQYTLQKMIYKQLQETRLDLSIAENRDISHYLKQAYYYTPEEAASREVDKISDAYYIPKIDVVAGMQAPSKFLCWLRNIGIELKNDCVNYPILYVLKNNLTQEIFLPLVSMEFEMSVSKHMNGGILNMSRNSFCGILVAPQEAIRHLRMMRKTMSCNNVIFYNVQ